MTPLVRVPTTEYHFVARALDCGALGVMVPLVDTAEQAERIVSFTRYPPQGRRGAAFGFAHDDYQGGDVVEKMRAIHERTLVICMIETRAGLENVDAIAAVDGVDVIWLGHFDLTNFLGIPGQFSHPQYRDAVKRIAAAAKKHGKSAGYMAASPELGREYLGHGYRMIATGTDQGLLQNCDCAAHLLMEKPFHVGVTSDILDSRGEPAFGREPLKALDAVQWEWLPKGLREITADLAATYDALYVNSPKVPAAAVARPDLRLKLVSRHGVGYDSVDVDGDDARRRAGRQHAERGAAARWRRSRSPSCSRSRTG